jgi:hypothetical protein
MTELRACPTCGFRGEHAAGCVVEDHIQHALERYKESIKKWIDNYEFRAIDRSDRFESGHNNALSLLKEAIDSRELEK